MTQTSPPDGVGHPVGGSDAPTGPVLAPGAAALPTSAAPTARLPLLTPSQVAGLCGIAVDLAAADYPAGAADILAALDRERALPTAVRVLARFVVDHADELYGPEAAAGDRARAYTRGLATSVTTDIPWCVAHLIAAAERSDHTTTARIADVFTVAERRTVAAHLVDVAAGMAAEARRQHARTLHQEVSA